MEMTQRSDLEMPTQTSRSGSIDLDKLRKISLSAILNFPNIRIRNTMKCPFHKERTPSFVIFPDNGYKCFGCGVKGKGPIDYFIQHGFEFRQVIKELDELKEKYPSVE